MKNLFLTSSLVLTLNSFSFWPMEDIYCFWAPKDKSWINSSPLHIKKLDESTEGEKKKVDGCFLFDKHTFNWIVFYLSKDFNQAIFYRLKSVDTLENWAPKFLKCDFTYDMTFWDKNNYIGGDIRTPSANGPFYNHQKFSGRNIPYNLSCKRVIEARKQFTSRSGVNINHVEGRVILRKDNKQIDLTTALRKYFDKSLYQENLIHSISHLSEGSAKKYLPVLYNFAHSYSCPVDCDLLNESTILAVWCLLPKIKDLKNNIKEGCESQIIGLARNKKGKLFHWSTNLGRDISILMQFASGTGD